MEEKGLIHIYCGDGKGKTTAALGLGLRACGRGLRVLLVRFLKDRASGELAAIEKLEGFTVIETPESLPFLGAMSEREKRQYAEYAMGMFQKAAAAAKNGQCDLLILDEVCAAVNYGVLAMQTVTELLAGKPGSLEVVLTGREPPQPWLLLADYVSEIHAVKHPYQQGVAARIGIEY